MRAAKRRHRTCSGGGRPIGLLKCCWGPFDVGNLGLAGRRMRTGWRWNICLAINTILNRPRKKNHPWVWIIFIYRLFAKRKSRWLCTVPFNSNDLLFDCRVKKQMTGFNVKLPYNARCGSVLSSPGTIWLIILMLSRSGVNLSFCAYLLGRMPSRGLNI